MAPGNSETQLEDVGPKGLLVVGGTVKEVITSFESQGAREYLSTLLQVKNLVVLLGSGASFHLGSPKTRDLTNPQVLELVRAAGCEPAEGLNSLFKAECIRNPVMRPKVGWKSVSDVEIAVAEYVDWFNH